MKLDSSMSKSGVDQVVPQTVTSIESSLEPYTSGGYLRRNPDWHAEDSSRKARYAAEILGKHGVQPRLVGEVGIPVCLPAAQSLNQWTIFGFAASGD